TFAYSISAAGIIGRKISPYKLCNTIFSSF
ncbi:MAG: hypothetical protein ACI8SZ_001211, partial [Colwellia sp.]